jgi:hypothetical protein
MPASSRSLSPDPAYVPSSAVSRTQRISFFAIAAVVAVVAIVIIAVAGGGNGSSRDGAASTGKVPLLTQGKLTKLQYTQGDQVTFRVRTNDADEVHVHGYDIERETQAGKPLRISFKATINGIFEIELHHANVQIAHLTVQPK